jgi:hypothetical protein
MGSEFFLSFPKEKPSLTIEREREKFDLRVPLYLGHGGALSWRTHSIRVLDGHSHVLRQPFPIWHNLYRPQVMAGLFVVAKYDARMTRAEISGAQGS